MKKYMGFISVGMMLSLQAYDDKSTIIVSDSDVIMANAATEVDLNSLQLAFVKAVIVPGNQSDFFKKFEKEVYDAAVYNGVSYLRPALEVLLPGYLNRMRIMSSEMASTRTIVQEIIHMPDVQEFLAYMYDLEMNPDIRKTSGITTRQVGNTRFIGGSRFSYMYDGRSFFTLVPSAGPAPRLRGYWNKFSQAVEEVKEMILK